MQTNSHKGCTKTHSVTCSLLRDQYNHEKRNIVIRVNTDTSFVMDLLYHCSSNNEYEIIRYDLQQYTYWKVFYLCDSRQITRMEPLSVRCLIQ
jgi:hypothetical protein